MKKTILKRVISGLLTITTVVGLAFGGLAACDDITLPPVGPGDSTNQITPTDPTNPTDPTQPENPDPENPVDPNPVDPNPVDPNPVDPNPVDPNPVDPNPVDPNPVDPNPVDPNPVDPNPVDPNPVDPNPGEEDPKPAEKLDYTVLDKAVESSVILSNPKRDTLNKIYSYGSDGNNFLVLADVRKLGTNSVRLYSTSISSTYSTKMTQAEINSFAESLSTTRMQEVFSLNKQSVDFTVDGDYVNIYKADGIEGPNKFAETLDIENPIMTWVGACGVVDLCEGSPTNLASGYTSIVIYEKDSQILVAKNKKTVACKSNATQAIIYDKSLNDEGCVLFNETEVFVLGKAKGSLFEEKTSAQTVAYRIADEQIFAEINKSSRKAAIAFVKSERVWVSQKELNI